MALAEPVTLKTTESDENERLDYALSAMQGYRMNMEDAHAIVLNIDAATGKSFIDVYDGHGGDLMYKDNNALDPARQAITSFPEVRTEEITQEDQFLIIAGDGIWISSSAMALAEPVTLKTTESGENERLDYTVSAMQGYRMNMEDAHAIVLNLDAATGKSFIGVYDGHGGPAVSKYRVRHLHVELHKQKSICDNLQTATEMDEMMKDRKAGEELSKYGGNENRKGNRKATRTSKPEYWGPETDGCTACVILIRGNQIIVGNAGDSRCVLSTNNQAVELSTDFKPDLPAERQRIEAAGHAVTFSERGNMLRIDDGIAISRSLGDLMYKDNNALDPARQAITSFPEVRTEEITQEDQFLIIACDGIWDCLKIHQAVEFIRIHSIADIELLLMSKSLLAHCLTLPACDQVKAHKLLPLPTNQAAINKAMYEMLNEAPVIRNTVTFVLDGHPHEVCDQYEFVMAHIRFWLVRNGFSINLNPILGFDRVVHMVPSEGTLYVSLRYQDKSATLVIDAREAWLYGSAGESAIVQFKRPNRTPYINHEYTLHLEEGMYSKIAPEGIHHVPIGVDPLRTLCSVMAEVTEESDFLEVNQQLGVAVVHLLEPVKFHELYETVRGSIRDGQTTTLNEKNPNACCLVNIWGQAGKKLGNLVFDSLCGNQIRPITLKTADVHGINSAEAICDNIFIMPWSFVPPKFRKSLPPVMQQLQLNSTWAPVDPGQGDRNVNPLQKLFRRIQGQKEQSLMDIKFVKDRSKFFGDRTGGKPCPEALSFVKSGGSWKEPLPVKGRSILQVVKIAEKSRRFIK